MISDYALQVSTAQAITDSAFSDDVIDLQVNRDVGMGEPLYMRVRVDSTFEGGTALAIGIVTSLTSNLNDGTGVIVSQTDAILAASLTEGATFYIPVSPITRERLPLAAGWRYMGAVYSATGTFTNGSLTTTFVKDPSTAGQPVKQYRDGI